MYSQQQPGTIQELFSSIAPSYDQANQIMSLGLHQRWNKALIRKVILSTSIKDHLDLCSGTGEIAFAYLKESKNPGSTYLLDFCGPMLDQARIKAESLKISQESLHFIVADAQEIPLPSSSVDGVTIAYGIRNIENPLRCAKEVFRVLREGGCWGILELTRPKNPLLKILHSLYLKGLLPLVGKIVSSNKEAYQYLSKSIGLFLSPSNLSIVLKEAGFSQVEIYPLFGGIATIIIAKKKAKS